MLSETRAALLIRLLPPRRITLDVFRRCLIRLFFLLLSVVVYALDSFDGLVQARRGCICTLQPR